MWPVAARSLAPRCDGEQKDVTCYKIDRLVDGTWQSGGWTEAKSYTYDVEQEAGKTVRLTWSASRPGLMIIVR